MNILKLLTIPNIIRLILPMILGFSFSFVPKCRITKSSGVKLISDHHLMCLVLFGLYYILY